MPALPPDQVRRSGWKSPLSLGRLLLHRRSFARQRRPARVAWFIGREGPGAVHGAAVVPDDQIALAPLVPVDELPLGRVVRQVAGRDGGLGGAPDGSEEVEGMADERRARPRPRRGVR